MDLRTSLVVTSIASPNEILKKIADGCLQHHIDFHVVGDVSSPKEFHLEGCQFHNLTDQQAMPFKFAGICPTKHYTRKNIGYLIAMKNGADWILDTDDDNYPTEGFWDVRHTHLEADLVLEGGWINVYGYFSKVRIWPRGLPLQEVKSLPPKPLAMEANGSLFCPIQQGLVDQDPDVDAVFRLVCDLPVVFDRRSPVALGRGSWCPFNSQNTAWSKEVFPLLYLPSTCTFRMTDIWRSFVAQRVLWAMGGAVLFHSATMIQDRNLHALLKDFTQEIPGYLHNQRIREILDPLPLEGGRGSRTVRNNLQRCYEALVSEKILQEEELPLLEAWLSDLEHLETTRSAG